MNIRAQQNEHSYIQKLASFRRLYSIAKKYNNGYVMLNIVMMTALTFLSIGLNSEVLAKQFNFAQVDYSRWLAVASIVVLTIDKLIIGDRIDSNREKAAKIQELFDRGLFKLDWNSTLAGSPPRIEDIVRHGEWYLKKYKNAKLLDWYSIKSDVVPHYLQVLICQNSSLYWDANLREKINYVVIIGGVAILAVALALCLHFDLSTSAILTNLTALLGPVLDYGYNTLKENKSSVEQAQRLLDCIEQAIANAETNPSEEAMRRSVDSIQDQLFVKRKSDWLIPDFFYKVLRNSDEAVMRQSTQQLEERFTVR
ncbi:S-4TM family putative pore-forming effector [Pseudomonas sp. TNT2022 ID1044]|uniref:S-4TM family putative pore-forming effector n=1 Tax=Pseudomonas sp. TNT2022 ID1044 TaxID=2942636 RepID=UPI00236261B2|nr:S-4TM family putative pore-forming effector [Pseudomonas sp. TNT2022 ID1044]MDD0999348.1 S-4TM family putative pore-forming effector [Pseudomonas sp. TNT2022 ID1044]